MEDIEDIRSMAVALQLAIRGGIDSDVIDCGTFGELLEALAGKVADKLGELAER